MEEKGGTNNSGVTVKGDEAPDSYRVVARENNEFGGSTVAPPVSEAVVTLEAAAATTQVSAALAAPGATAPAAAATPTPVSAPVAAATPTPVSAPVAAAVTTPATVSVSSPAAGAATTPATVAVTMPVAAGVTGTEAKKKRGRPRKYGPDGKVMALSPMPISALIPLTGDFSAWKHGRGRSIDSFKKKHKLEFESPGSRVSYSVGANFTPHVITVNAGEDVTMKIISFSQQGSRAICILAANGTISNVTLRQPNSCGGTLTYEGRFEILSLTGSFMPTDSGGTKSRSGGMSVSLAGPDGRVVGGGLAGLLIAAGPVQVVVGSFLPGHQQEQKPKKQRFEPVAIPAFTPAPANIISGEVTEGTYFGAKPNLTSSFPFPGDNLASMNPMPGSKNLATEDKVSPGGESEDASPPKFEVSC